MAIYYTSTIINDLKNDNVKKLNLMKLIINKLKEIKQKLDTITLFNYQTNNIKYVIPDQPIFRTAIEWINSFKNNQNPGVSDEIKVGLSILVSCGLERIENIPKKYFINVPNIIFNNVVGLCNITQNDNMCGTADIGIIMHNNKILYYSVTQWQGLKKCIRNPSPKIMYNMKKHIEIINKRNHQAFKDAVFHRMTNCSNTPNKTWKRVSGCLVTEKICNDNAKLAAEEWNLFSPKVKFHNLKVILDLDEKLKPNCSGIIYFDVKNNIIKKMFKWHLKINLDNCGACVSEGIYVKHYYNSECIIKTQVKYNNGIIEGLNDKHSWVPKPGSPISSWNCVAYLEKIFDMHDITIIN